MPLLRSFPRKRESSDLRPRFREDERKAHLPSRRAACDTVAMASPPRASSVIVPLIVGCAQFMHQFDGTMITTALPVMAVSLNEDPLTLNLAVTCYLLALAVFVPISGWMADRFGARHVFLAAI